MDRNFQHELQQLLNRCSAENASDTPDYVLSEYLTMCLDAYNRAVWRRDMHEGKSKAQPVQFTKFD